MKALSLAALAAIAISTPSFAQSNGRVAASGTRAGPFGFIIGDANNTGGRQGTIISQGATGADTIFSSSSVGSNVARPELAVPNGSSGGGGTK